MKVNLEHILARKLGKAYLDWESWVAGWARHDKGRCQSVHLIERQGHIEWRWEWALAEGGTDVCRVAGLNSQDRAGGGQVVSAHDIGCGTQVGADTNTLEDGGSHNEALDVSDTEVVFAGGHRGCASLGETGSQEGDVGLLVRGNCLQVGVKGCVEASAGKVGLGEVLEGFLVEGVLEVLQCQGVVEDVSVRDGWRCLTDELQAEELLDGRTFLSMVFSSELTCSWLVQPWHQQRELQQRKCPS